MKNLLAVITIVVAGMLNAQAITFSFDVPQGIPAIKAFVSQKVDTVYTTIGPENWDSSKPNFIWGTASDPAYSAYKGDLTEYAKSLVPAAFGNLQDPVMYREHDLNFYLEGQKFVTGYEIKKGDDGHLTRVVYTSPPWQFVKNADGSWSLPPEASFIDEDALYGGPFGGSPDAILAIQTGEEVKWVEYRIGGSNMYDTGIGEMGEFSQVSRNGWPPGCWATKPVEVGGLGGNGNSYVYASRVSGPILLDAFNNMYKNSVEGGFSAGIPVELWDMVIFWVNQAETQGFFWKTTASLDGISFSKGQIGFPGTKAEKAGYELKATFGGLVPGKSYAIYSTDSVKADPLTSPSSVYLDTFKANDDGEIKISRHINPDKVMEIFKAIPANDVTITITGKVP